VNTGIGSELDESLDFAERDIAVTQYLYAVMCSNEPISLGSCLALIGVRRYRLFLATLQNFLPTSGIQLMNTYFSADVCTLKAPLFVLTWRREDIIKMFILMIHPVERKPYYTYKTHVYFCNNSNKSGA
jgi:hypothetical protein